MIVHFSWSPEKKLFFEGHAGPHVVQQSQVPCAWKSDKAGEHVVMCQRCHAVTGMADKIFPVQRPRFRPSGCVTRDGSTWILGKFQLHSFFIIYVTITPSSTNWMSFMRLPPNLFFKSLRMKSCPCRWLHTLVTNHLCKQRQITSTSDERERQLTCVRGRS